MAQVVGNLLGISLLPYAHAPWLGINLGCIREDRPAHPLIYDLLVLEVVIGKHPEKDNAHNQEHCHARAHHWVGEAAAEAFKARNFDLKCHLLGGAALFSQTAWRARALPAGLLRRFNILIISV